MPTPPSASSTVSYSAASEVIFQPLLQTGISFNNPAKTHKTLNC